MTNKEELQKILANSGVGHLTEVLNPLLEAGALGEEHFEIKEDKLMVSIEALDVVLTEFMVFVHGRIEPEEFAKLALSPQEAKDLKNPTNGEASEK